MFLVAHRHACTYLPPCWGTTPSYMKHVKKFIPHSWPFWNDLNDSVWSDGVGLVGVMSKVNAILLTKQLSVFSDFDRFLVFSPCVGWFLEVESSNRYKCGLFSPASLNNNVGVLLCQQLTKKLNFFIYYFNIYIKFKSPNKICTIIKRLCIGNRNFIINTSYIKRPQQWSMKIHIRIRVSTHHPISSITNAGQCSLSR